MWAPTLEIPKRQKAGGRTLAAGLVGLGILGRPPMKPASKPLPRRRVWQMEMIEDGGKVDSD